MGYDNKDEVQSESKAILQAAGYRDIGGRVMKKMTPEELKADNDRHLEMMRKQHQATESGFQRFIRKLFNR